MTLITHTPPLTTAFSSLVATMDEIAGNVGALKFIRSKIALHKFATTFWTEFLMFLSHKTRFFLIFGADMFGSQCGCASNQPPNSKVGKLVDGQAGGISGDVGLL